ncbi:MAG: MBL fold metallo-hydrolase [Chitinophagales bacterium]|jgi:glyoxylase-like metal-dependent hydrolase (beta-lactamase superfamily II)|nr:MBL fold metallo-hydrolase [Chitinophagales bacterium]
MVVPLYEGRFTVDISKKFIPFDASIDSMKDRPASLLVDIVPFLVKTRDELIVIDPGLGQQNNGSFPIHQNIKSAGHSHEEVSMVLLSHLHKDHAGGIGYYEDNFFKLMFPNAKYYCQQKEMEQVISTADSPSYEEGKLRFLKDSINLQYLNGDGMLKHGISYEISGGHTQYHQVFTIVIDGQSFFFGGDVLPQPKQLLMKYVAKYDFDGNAAAARRIEYGKRTVANGGICLFFHSYEMPGAKIQMDKAGKFQLERALL